MQKTLTPLFLVSFVIAATLTGCMAEGLKGAAPPDLNAAKADGNLEIVDNGPLAFGESVASDVEAGIAQAWTFSLSAGATVSFGTGAGADGSVDTIVYLHDADERELAVDDDGGEDLFSALSMELSAGTYRVAVAGYGDSAGPFSLRADCAGEGCSGDAPPVSDDPWAMARDVNLHHVAFTEATPIPQSFSRAEGISPISLSSPEWWQRWSGGATQSFNWSEGSDYGKRCGQASAIRLQAIIEHEVTDPSTGEVSRPGLEAFDALRDGSGWSGTMYNWTEDISGGGSASFSPATIWAWRTTAIKWINVVHPDGSCDLPTLELVQRYSARCLQQAASDGGEIQGCSASAR